MEQQSEEASDALDQRVQQAGDNRRREESGQIDPPRLPRYGGSAQATIESIPEAGSRSVSAPTAPQRDTARSAAATSGLEDKSRILSAKPDRSHSASRSDYETYVVQEGDNFWKISVKKYGSGKYCRALEEHNAERLTRTSGKTILRPGAVVELPPLAVLTARDTSERSSMTRSASASEPHQEPGVYRVREGDTLMEIASQVLGTSKRWREILELNRDKLKDERSLKVGMELRMPLIRPGERMADGLGAGR
jgi:nucleoid-associated protein YgaU